jgi:hypothetical protein
METIECAVETQGAVSIGGVLELPFYFGEAGGVVGYYGDPF